MIFFHLQSFSYNTWLRRDWKPIPEKEISNFLLNLLKNWLSVPDRPQLNDKVFGIDQQNWLELMIDQIEEYLRSWPKVFCIHQQNWLELMIDQIEELLRSWPKAVEEFQNWK